MKVWIVGAVGGLALAAALMTFETTPDLPPGPLRNDGDPIRVEVLNGSSVNGAGLALAEALRGKGFDVVSIRNADRSDYEQTIVLDRVGKLEYADAVAETMGGLEPRSHPKDSLLLEVTVILGKDHAEKLGGESLMARQKSLGFLIFMIVLGIVVGSAVGEAIGNILPEGVVKNFFLDHAETGFGPTPINLVAFTLTVGVQVKVNIMAVLGVLLAAYLFRWY